MMFNYLSLHTEPLVSICMPVYNGAQFVHSSIASLLQQTYRNLEILVVDDGSKDNTLDILHSIKDPRLRIIENSKNAGNLTRRNQAFDLCQGDYIAIMDADDICQPDRVERQIACLRQGYQLCASWVNAGLTPGRIQSNWKMPTHGFELIRSCLIGSPMANPTVMMTRNELDRKNFRFDLSFFPAADYHAWATKIFVEERPSFIIPKPLVFRRHHGESISHRNRAKQDKQADAVRRTLLQYLDVPDDLIDVHNAGRVRKLSNEEMEKLTHLYRDVLPQKMPGVFDSGHIRLPAHNTTVTFGLPETTISTSSVGVSIIIPAYNVKDYLEECVVSVFAGNSGEHEVIIVDDGSVDGTSEVCKSMVDRFPGKVRVIWQENGGLSAARNTGQRYATGEYVYFLDGDDFLEPGAIDRLYSVAKAEKADIVVPIHVAFFEDTGKQEPRIAINAYTVYRNNIFDHFSWRRFGYTAAVKLIHRELANQVTFTEGLLHEDELYCPELFLKARSVVTLPEVMYYYRQRSGSITSVLTQRHVEHWLYISDRVLDLCLSFGLTPHDSLGFGILMSYFVQALRNKLDRLEAPDEVFAARAIRDICLIEAKQMRICSTSIEKASGSQIGRQDNIGTASTSDAPKVGELLRILTLLRMFEYVPSVEMNPYERAYNFHSSELINLTLLLARTEKGLNSAFPLGEKHDSLNAIHVQELLDINRLQKRSDVVHRKAIAQSTARLGNLEEMAKVIALLRNLESTCTSLRYVPSIERKIGVSVDELLDINLRQQRGDAAYRKVTAQANMRLRHLEEMSEVVALLHNLELAQSSGQLVEHISICDEALGELLELLKLYKFQSVMQQSTRLAAAHNEKDVNELVMTMRHLQGMDRAKTQKLEIDQAIANHVIELLALIRILEAGASTPASAGILLQQTLASKQASRSTEDIFTGGRVSPS